MTGFKYALVGLAMFELVGCAFALAMCRCAARRPTFGPPVAETRPARRSTDHA